MQIILKNSGFSLIELIIVMTIASLLAGLGFSGYMDSIRVQKRQDAVLSLQKAYLFINSVNSPNNITNPNSSCTTSSCCTTTSCSSASPCSLNTTSTTSSITFPCTSTNGFYCINYCPIGYLSSNIASNSDKLYLTTTESLILQASAIPGSGQDKDTPTSCQTIYFSNQNLYHNSIFF